ncbi:MAG TPA: acylphosphatase, partial [Stellaceae bacterium]|nr:acylphosphatase [Stellaceae bacterium]
MASARHVIVTGRVQGVGYRAWTVREARKLALRGFVRNRQDGSVEILVMGEASALERMIKACHYGPPTSRVDTVTVAEAED